MVEFEHVQTVERKGEGETSMMRGTVNQIGIVGLALVSVLAAAGETAGDVIIIGAEKDNTLYEDFQGAWSNGAGEYMFAGSTAGHAYRRALVAFDIASVIAPGSTITSVTLRLHMSRTIVGDQTVSLHRVLADWGEGASDAPGEEGLGAPSEPGDATWIHTFYDSGFWTNAGGDFDAVASSSILVGGSEGYYTWGSTANMVSDVQLWLDDPDSAFGWELIGNESRPATAKRFDTRENGVESFRPMLTIEYEPIPAAGSAAGVLLGGGLVFGGRRRRR